jgi:hypothetical protein
MKRPAVKLSALRRIGWEVWDPIGIRDCVNDEYSEGPADEYDNYLIVAFGMAQSGRSESEIATYLGDVASNYMGLGKPNDGGKSNLETAHQLAVLATSLT